ncbi:uncharacterized protein BX663DRAFT_505343 [Cokeromyces recurvatus]|uniref:uncharacterized protein n=1 Tax=Cokeromyces recurvatus TaxID=90255 RepID=UPI00221FE9BB|nr:uncharacterized protein BX663DRAFT_505343 [Cokeromyces recurvatus]KAI7903822.1 hypothetical protein BX663DRAFT_505343 [Cokeromyces recurvatus]
MLLSIEHHQELLNVGWEIRRIENKPYYIKHIFKEKEYMILITDLCLVWFEHGNFKRIQQNARIPNIDIETEKESMTLLVRVKKLFLDKNNVRTLIQKKSNQLLVHCKPVVNQYRRNEQYNIVNAFLWIFHCDLLDQQGTNDKFKSGPQIIFEHFIQPIQAIVNYFTENLSDDNYTKINMEKSSFSVYSTTSLDYMSKFIYIIYCYTGVFNKFRKRK